MCAAAALRYGERGDRGRRQRATGARAAERAAVPTGGVERPRCHPDDINGARLLIRLRCRCRDAPAAKVMQTSLQICEFCEHLFVAQLL